MGVYDNILAKLKDRAEHGFGIYCLTDDAYLEEFGREVMLELIDDLKADGFKIIGDPDKFGSRINVMW